MRFGIPCMVLTGSGGEVTVSGWTDWAEWAAALEAASPGIAADARPLPTPAEAFATWPLLTRPELEMLCGPDHELPPDVVRHGGRRRGLARVHRSARSTLRLAARAGAGQAAFDRSVTGVAGLSSVAAASRGTSTSSA